MVNFIKKIFIKKPLSSKNHFPSRPDPKKPEDLNSQTLKGSGPLCPVQFWPIQFWSIHFGNSVWPANFGRHSDLMDVLEFGTRNENLEMTSRVVAGRIWQRFCRDSRYGLRGVRVGEALNPGPAHNRTTCQPPEVSVASASASTIAMVLGQ